MYLPVLGPASEISGRLKTWYLNLAKWHPGILGFSAYGSDREARILCRVLMTRNSAERSWLQQSRGWRQFVDTQSPRQPVLLHVGKAIRIVEADRGGYVDTIIRGHQLSAGWHEARVHVIHKDDFHRAKSELIKDLGWGRMTPQLLASRAHKLGIRITPPTVIPLRIVGNNETVGVISDVDDTIIVSELPHPLAAIRYALLENSAKRSAVPGMAGFLKEIGLTGALAATSDLKATNTPPTTYDSVELPPPQIYLSAGAWNTVPTLRAFLKGSGFPHGQLLMRSWWVTDNGLPTAGTEFKLGQLEFLVKMLPHIKWILIGDNGQHDPATFSLFAKKWPDRLAAICIRTLNTKNRPAPAETTRTVHWVDKSSIPKDVPVVYGEDGFEMSRTIRQPGFKHALEQRLNSNN